MIRNSPFSSLVDIFYLSNPRLEEFEDFNLQTLQPANLKNLKTSTFILRDFEEFILKQFLFIGSCPYRVTTNWCSLKFVLKILTFMRHIKWEHLVFMTLMQLILEYASKCLCTSMHKIKLQHSSGRVFFVCGTQFILLPVENDMQFRLLP